MSAVDDMLAALCTREGGGAYTNSPTDKGGPTRYGVTQRQARAYGYNGDMRMLPQQTAIDIYRKMYWAEPGYYDISLRYPRLAEKMLDTGVNMGPETASRFLQRALNGLNRGAAEYPDMREDGRLGPISLHALDIYKQHRGDAGEQVLIDLVSDQQGVRYLDICENDSTQEMYLYGWISNRESLMRCAK